MRSGCPGGLVRYSTTTPHLTGSSAPPSTAPLRLRASCTTLPRCSLNAASTKRPLLFEHPPSSWAFTLPCRMPCRIQAALPVLSLVHWLYFFPLATTRVVVWLLLSGWYRIRNCTASAAATVQCAVKGSVAAMDVALLYLYLRLLRALSNKINYGSFFYIPSYVCMASTTAQLTPTAHTLCPLCSCLSRQRPKASVHSAK